jgi:type IV pilus biogenesis protein CpaD/CtpE
MDISLSRIEVAGSAGASDEPDRAPGRLFRSGLIWLPISLIVALAAWVLLSSYSGTAGDAARTEPAHPATTAATEPVQQPAADTALNSFAAIPSSEEAAAPEQAAVPLDGLKIASQSWRRGGLGSIALVTFTLQNTNAYPVKDIQISCAFNRRDGSHLTDRARVIHDTVNTKSRKTFARVHVGFVNVTAAKAKCALVAASPV